MEKLSGKKLKFREQLFLPLILASLPACMTSPPESRQTEPAVPEAKTSQQLRPFEQKTLKNGLKIYFIQDDSLPRVSMSLLVKVGLAQESVPGVNSITAEMLDQGTQNHSATEIADELGGMGTGFSSNAGSDFTMFSADTLSISAEPLIKLFSEIVQRPVFSDNEIARVKSQTLSYLARKKDNPSGLADDFYEEQVFRGHPYQRDTVGNVESVTSLKKKDMIQHYLTWYRPNNSLLAVVGALDSKMKNLVVQQMEAWTPKNPPQLSKEDRSEALAPALLLYTKKGLAQTQIRMGLRGIPRNNPDYLTLRLAFEILGGSFASRLMQTVRDDLGLTYSIYSSVDARLEPGVFSISTFTKNSTVKQTILETQKTLQNYLSSGPKEKELKAAQNQLIGQFPRALETADRFAANILGLEVYGVPMSYLTDFNKNVQKVTVEDIRRVLKKYVNPEKLRTTVYGDIEVEQQLQELQPDIVRL